MTSHDSSTLFASTCECDAFSFNLSCTRTEHFSLDPAIVMHLHPPRPTHSPTRLLHPSRTRRRQTDRPNRQKTSQQFGLSVLFSCDTVVPPPYFVVQRTHQLHAPVAFCVLTSLRVPAAIVSFELMISCIVCVSIALQASQPGMIRSIGPRCRTSLRGGWHILQCTRSCSL